jgi:hypothetical protein
VKIWKKKKSTYCMQFAVCSTGNGFWIPQGMERASSRRPSESSQFAACIRNYPKYVHVQRG